MVKKKRQADSHEDGSTSDSSTNSSMQSPGSHSSCVHIKKSVDTTRLRKALKTSKLAVDCMQCSINAKKKTENFSATNDDLNSENTGFEYDNTLWMCLKCGTQLCGRSKNQHALLHYKTPHSDCHSLAINTRSFEIWCYDCDNEVKANSRKNLLECVEILKRTSQKQTTTAKPTIPSSIENIEQKILGTWETVKPLVNKTEETRSNIAIPLPPIPPPPPIPGMAKRVNDASLPGNCGGATKRTNLLSINALPFLANSHMLTHTPSSENLPRVRGLTNLGNTCFFNAVLQCLAQTPYLLDVLKESAEPGEEFILPGGTFKFKDDENVELPKIQGLLSSWGTLTASLAQALEELQSGGGIFTPSKLFDKLCTKCPQFRGGDQHDSHELLRQLLESVRSEDLKRYQRVILQNLGYKDQESVSDEMRQKCKIYGNQAADRILRPDQVFRGFLVSTLTCQICYNVSSRHEYFLDLSLPVSVDKPLMPQRRKPSPDKITASFFLEPIAPTAPEPQPTKAQLRKERKMARKSWQLPVVQNNKHETTEMPNTTANVNKDDKSVTWSSSSSCDQSDADVEDNLIDCSNSDKQTNKVTLPTAVNLDTNGNNKSMATILPSPGVLEKRDDSPENIDKDSLEEDENDSGIATSPAYTGSNHNLPTTTNLGGNESDKNIPINSSIMSRGLSEKGANIVRTLSLNNELQISQQNGQTDDATNLADKLANDLQLKQKAARSRAKRIRTQSHSDWNTTIAPRIYCEDDECSIQSCLYNFTAVELMNGNNKVGCDHCTRQAANQHNKENEGATANKTVYTDATKQFLISSPPAVLILHLKRFQLGPRCIFRKLTRAVSYPLVLDIAPFCGSKVKNLPNIDRKQKKLLYALYGIVEHSGGMYGGHYTAYVKVRTPLANDDKRWKFIPQGSKAELDQDDEQRKKLDELLAKERARELRLKATHDSDDFSSNSNTTSTSNSASSEDSDNEPVKEPEACNVKVPDGKWYYVSDSRKKYL